MFGEFVVPADCTAKRVAKSASRSTRRRGVFTPLGC